MNMHMYLSLSMCKPNMVNLISMSHIQRQNTQTLLMIKCFGFFFTLISKETHIHSFIQTISFFINVKILHNFRGSKFANDFRLLHWVFAVTRRPFDFFLSVTIFCYMFIKLYKHLLH